MYDFLERLLQNSFSSDDNTIIIPLYYHNNTINYCIIMVFNGKYMVSYSDYHKLDKPLT